MGLYSWQKKCLKEWETSQYRGIINAVTGSGKTTLALACIRTLQGKYPDLRVRIVVPTIALANQWRQAVLRDKVSQGRMPGFFGNGIRDDFDRPVMIYVVNSARDSLAAHIRKDFALRRHVLLICDECHRYISRENYKMFDFLTNEKSLSGDYKGSTDTVSETDTRSALSSFLSLYHCLGLSATPFDGERDEALKRVLGDEIFKYDFSDAADDGVIAPYAICQVSVDFIPKERDSYAKICDRITKATVILYQIYPWLKNLPQGRFYKELRSLAASNDMDPSDPAAALLMLFYQRKALVINSKARNLCCMSLLRLLRGNEKILIFCERIEQAEALQRQITREYGSICGIYHSQLSMEAKRRNLADFRNNHIRILVSCRALDEGLDVPDAEIGIVLSSSAMTRQRIQRLGRIIRTNPEKDQACLYYLYIRESSEDAAYLKKTDYTTVFDLRYYTNERDFSNDLYLYSSIQLIDSFMNDLKTEDKENRNRRIAELRKCIQEGLVRSDYLLSEKLKDKRLAAATSVHERNYWCVMRWIGKRFQNSDRSDNKTF